VVQGEPAIGGVGGEHAARLIGEAHAPGGAGVTCSPAMKPSLSQRSRVDGAMFSWRAAAVTLSSSPSAGGLLLGWWQGMCQWVLSEAPLLAVKDIPRAVVRCCRLRMPAMTASG